MRALALVGSWARGAARPDSDVDLVLLTDRVATYVEDDHWITEIGAVALIRTESWGAITERRVALPSGLEVEVGVGRPAWAATAPIDAGTRRVVHGGLRILHDPDGLLAALQSACREP